MNSVNLSNLVYKGNRIIWIENIGKIIPFVYRNYMYNLKILDYDIQTERVTVSCNDKVMSMRSKQIRDCNLGALVNVKTLDYKYNIGDVIGNLEILKQIRIKGGKNSLKGYEYQCLVCKCNNSATENNIVNGCGCPVCVGKKVVVGINDMWTTNPQMAKLLADNQDGFKYTQRSNNNAKWECPACSNVFPQKIGNVYFRGLSCPKCGDGFSFPNKFVYNVLDQLGANFETEKKFAWSQNRKYDFFIPDLNFIIEVHGKQHYVSIDWSDLENDEIKYTLAKTNGIYKYIIIDAQESSGNYIIKNLKNSELINSYDFSKVDLLTAEEYATSTLVKKICDVWNINKSTLLTSKAFRMNRSTVTRYLHKGNRLGWCKYDTSEEIKKSAKLSKNGKQVEIFKDGISFGVFESCKELERKSMDVFGQYLKSSNISAVCTNVRRNYKGYTFKYI